MDERLIAKYEREAKEKNRESWYMAYIMDTNEEERAKGKTVEVGRAHFETVKKRCGWRGGAVSRHGGFTLLAGTPFWTRPATKTTCQT